MPLWEVFLLHFLFLSVSLPNCGSLGEKNDRKVTQADFIRLEKFAKKHEAMGIAALEQEPRSLQPPDWKIL